MISKKKDAESKKYNSFLKKMFENNYSLFKKEFVLNDSDILQICKLQSKAAKNQEKNSANIVAEDIVKNGLNEKNKKDFHFVMFSYSALIIQDLLVSYHISSPFPTYLTMNKCYLAIAFAFFISVFSSDLFVDKESKKDSKRVLKNKKLIMNFIEQKLQYSKKSNTKDIAPLFDSTIINKVAQTFGEPQKNDAQSLYDDIVTNKKKEELPN